MLVVHRRGNEERELELGIDRATATVAELARILGEPGGHLVIDGTPVDADLSLVETPLVRGSVITAPAPRAAAAARPPATTLVSVAGMGAGRRLPLDAGSWLIGRHPGADVVVDSPTVSARHAGLRISADGSVEVRDLASHNGTWLGARAVGDDWVPVADGDLLRLGAVIVRFERRPPGDRAGALDPRRHADRAGRVTLDRPPRRPPAPAAEPLRTPEPPRPDRQHPGLALLPALLPAVGGLTTLAITGNWLFALVPLLSPIVVLATWEHGRRRAGRAGRREEARFGHELARLAVALSEVVGAEVARRRAEQPDLGEVVRRAGSPSTRLWERRPGDRDWLVLALGSGSVPCEAPVIHRPDPLPDRLAAVLADADRLPEAPVVADLGGGGVLGVVGPPALARAAARALVLQAAVHHGPADLSVAVLTSAEAATAWTWSRWLPHAAAAEAAAQPGDGSTIRVGAASSRALLRDLLVAAERRPRRGDRPGAPPSSDGPTRLVVVDDDGLLRGARAPARAVLRGEAGPVAGIVVAASTDRLPASCTAVLELRGSDGRAVLRPLGGGPAAPAVELLVAGLAEPDARIAARALARFEDGEQADRQAALARRVGLVDLLGLPGPAVRPVGAGGPVDLGADSALVDELTGRWRVWTQGRGLAVPLGSSVDGPVVVDLVADGPHALVAGTTGSGKSELLRTWVAALASTVDPRRLNVILVDYKGGSAFDACAGLAHTVAVITDLDEALAARALRCLEAEIRHREEVLRRAGVADLADLEGRAAGADGLARLVVVVDEFATLAAELPEFLSSLVGVAQRGRSLGLHLVLATQRPAGVVSEAIRANTAIRIALRVQDRHDSRDVLGDERAADLPRDVPGRAVVRFGPGELVTMQVAVSSGAGAADGREAEVGPGPGAVRVLPATGGWDPLATGGAGPTMAGGLTIGGPAAGGAGSASELTRLVDAAGAAARQLGIGPSRRPWTPPLPAGLDLDDLDEFEGSDVAAEATEPGDHGDRDDCDDLVELMLVDDPDHQARYRGGWRRRRGNLLVAGAVGSGTTTTLGTVAAALTRRHHPTRLHLYGIDGGGGELAALAALPHCGGIVSLGDGERLARLIGWLAGELDRRRGLTPSERSQRPALVLLVDGWSALQAELDGPAGLEPMAQLSRVVLDGPAVGIATVLGADRPGAVRHQLAATIAQRIVLRLADPFEARALGLPTVADVAPGRGVDATTGLVVQVARPGPSGLAAAVDAVAARWPQVVHERNGGPWPVGRLPLDVAVADLLRAPALVDPGAGPSPGPSAGPGARPRPAGPPAAGFGAGQRPARPPAAGDTQPWYLPLGIGSATLGPVGLTLQPGEHVLVAGPARSGRTTALRLIADVARRIRPDLAVVGVAGRRSALGRSSLDTSLLPHELSRLELFLGGGPLLVLLDDAEGIDDGGGLLSRLADGGVDGVCLVAAGRGDALRVQYGTWVRRVRASRLGVLLQPDPDVDGDLLGVRLPRRSPVPPAPGRGWLAEGGRAELVQLARPAEGDPLERRATAA